MAMLYSINQIVSDAQMELGIAQKPVSTVVTSLDEDVVQMLSLMSAVADDVLLEEPYKITLGDGVWVSDTDGNPKQRPTTDTDLILFDGRLAIDGLKYRFLKAKGMEFGEEMRDYVARQNKLAGRSNARVLDLDVDEGRQI
jgi:hypothetical protein